MATMPMPPPPPSAGDTPPMPMPMPPMDMTSMPTMHAAFFWGHRVQVLFSNWPGVDRDGAGMYALCLLAVAALAALAEVLGAWSRAAAAAAGRGSVDALEWTWTLQVTWLHVLKVGLSYLVMLAAMSFNGGVFLAAVAGHAAGFLVAQIWMPLRPATRDGVDDVHTNGAALPPSSRPN